MARKPKNTDAKTESAREKFLRLAPSRTENALKKISLLGNLAGHGYEFEPSESRQIIEALQDAVNEVSNKFNKSKAGRKGSGGFSFTSSKRAAAAA